MKHACLLLTLASTIAAGTAGSSRKPNVLFIVVDDLKPTLGCYGDTLVKSPNIDRLAAQGTLFTRAYCMQAVCAPSRNAVLTGLRPESLRIYDMATNFRQAAPDVVTLPQLFKNHGWQVHGIGKIFHVGHGNHDDPASWDVPPSRPGGPYALKDSTGGNAPTDKWVTGKPVENADVPDTAYADGKHADTAIKRLRAFKNSGKPFFLAVGFHKPHLPFCAPKKYWNLYQRDSFRIPVRQTLPDGAPSFAGHNFPELRSYTDIPQAGPVTAARARELIHGYHACVSYMDAQLGRVLTELDNLGLRDNTIIVLWGDHGWHLGDHGLWCKHTNFEQAARSPLVVSLPRQLTAGTKCDAVVELVDIYPTLCENAGIAKPLWLQGRSLTSLLEKPTLMNGDYAAFHVFPRQTREYGPLLGQAVRTARWRLVEWQLPDGKCVARELYDYQTDPDETVNLASHSKSAGIVTSLSTRLKERLDAPMPSGLRLQMPAISHKRKRVK